MLIMIFLPIAVRVFAIVVIISSFSQQGIPAQTVLEASFVHDRDCDQRLKSQGEKEIEDLMLPYRDY
jgi:hypothetical protein